MQAFLAICLSILLGINPAPSSTYVAVIATRDRAWMWHKPKYAPDYLGAPRDWEEFPAMLKDIATKSGTRPILLDVHVHGIEEGLYLQEDVTSQLMYSDRANMGYLVSEIEKAFVGRKFSVLCESCFAGRAYKYTIRDSVRDGCYDNITNYDHVPPFPIYGTGDNFANVGPLMYLQWKYNFRKYWVDLRAYDPKGQNKALSPKESEPDFLYSKTSLDIARIWQFFQEEIP